MKIGTFVVYRLPDTEHESPRLRPALVVRVWSEDCVNLQVFCDGSNDEDFLGSTSPPAADWTAWVTSATSGDDEGYWREPEPAPEVTA